MILGLYTRVSTDTQVRGESLTDQEHDGEAWAQANGHDVVAVFSDPGVSGKLPAAERPGLAAALENLAAGTIDGLLVRDLDRLARELTVQEAVLAQVWSRPDTVVLEYASGREVLRDDPDDPMRTAMRQMAGVFAELDRRMVAKKLRDGRRNKARRGQHANGPAPFGWRSVDGDLDPLADEQATLRRMHEVAASGVTHAAVAATLTEEGWPTRNGGAWSQPVVSRVLAREASLSPMQRAYRDLRLAHNEHRAATHA